MNATYIYRFLAPPALSFLNRFRAYTHLIALLQMFLVATLCHTLSLSAQQIPFVVLESDKVHGPWIERTDALVNEVDAGFYQVQVMVPHEAFERYYQVRSTDPVTLFQLSRSLVIQDGLSFQVMAVKDSDQDGWLDFEDCAPLNPNVHPGLVEICGDGLDNDCSGLADDLDADRDGYLSVDCGGDDTDDASASIHPMAPEICGDGIDNNGNGLVDAEDPMCTEGCDLDQDGYAGMDCGGPDVNDLDATVYPGAEEICGDFVDNDQDGRTDESCFSGELRIGPENLKMVSGTARDLLVLKYGEIQDETPWNFYVNDLAGGTETFGIIQANPLSPGRLRFIAPEVSERTVVRVAAVDPLNPFLRAETEIEVYPFVGDLVISPSNLSIGLGRTRAFRAFLDVLGVGLLPLPDVYWYVKQQQGGGRLNGADLGRIDSDGNYTAPGALPSTLPMDLTIGFSLGAGQLPLKTARLVLNELVLAPNTFVGMNAGPVGQVVAGVVIDSNGGVVPVQGNNLAYASFSPSIANVNFNGGILIGADLGSAVVLVTDIRTGARDTVTVHSRSDVELAIEVIEGSHQTVRISPGPDNAAQIEYTCSGARFEVRPLVKRLRGPQAGNPMSGRMASVVTLEGDGENVISYGPSDRVPQATGVTAVLRSDNGIVTMGDEPGSGKILVSYDDGFVQHTKELTVIYTRPEISVTTIGRRSAKAEPYLTEEVEVTIHATNQGGFSDFLGELPLRISLIDAEGQPMEMDIFYRNSPFSGFAWAFASPLNLNTRTSSFELTTASTLDHLDGFSGGKMYFRFFAPKAGTHTLRIENRCDTRAPALDQILTIHRPPLALRHTQPRDIDPTSPWVKGSWMNVFHRAEDVPQRVSIYDIYSRDSVESFARNDIPRWHVLYEGTEVATVPITDDSLIDAPGVTGQGGLLNFTPEESGDWTVYLGMTQRTHLRSEDLPLNVVEPTEVGEVAVNPIEDTFGVIIPRERLLGALQIVEKPPGPWVIGQSFELKVQTYPAGAGGGPIFPQTIGHELVFTRISNGQISSETVTTVVGGVRLRSISGHSFEMEGNLYPAGPDGLISVRITPTDGDSARDLILSMEPTLYTFNEGGLVAGLPRETRVHNEGRIARLPEGGNVPGIADFTDSKNDTFHHQCSLIPGRGLAFSPRFLPLTSDRVVQAVQEQRLPLGKDKVIFYAEGAGQSFLNALAAGVSPSAISNLPEGAVVENVRVVNQRLEITLNTNGASPPGRRELTIQLNGLDWKGPVQFVQLELDHPVDHDNEHIPLNGDHHQMHPIGSNMIIATQNWSSDPAIPNTVRLHLIPSMKPGSPDFRGLEVTQPIVGWKRELNDEGDFVVSELEQDWLVQRNNFVIVYGNTTDHATLDPNTGLNNMDEGPDMLPDFVSTSANAETAAVSIGGNFLDAMFFTAFNFIAKPEAEDVTSVPQLDFDQLKNGSVQDVYGAYQSGARGLRPQSGGSSGPRVGVSVDTEADFYSRMEDGPFPHIRTSGSRVVPAVYHAGILDQYYLAELRGDAYRNPPGRFYASLGQDGRVGSFDGDFGSKIRLSTGTTPYVRKSFGIELDGVIYDPSLLMSDDDPNDDSYLTIPIIRNFANQYQPQGYTESLHLFPDIGGSSGGWFDLQTGGSNDKVGPLGAWYLTSKTPGADFPGIYVGYPIQGSPNDLRDPYFETIKDDIEEAALKREHAVGPLTNERAARMNLFDDRRRMMTYGSQHDHKTAISTSLSRTFHFQITTDPPGVDGIIFRAGLKVNELPREVEDAVDLIVTTQSDGWEDTIKLVYDGTIDVVANIVATVVLNYVSGGSYGAYCGAESVSSAAQSAIKSAVEQIAIDALGQQLFSEDYFQVEGTPLYGRRRTPQLTFKAINPDLLNGQAPVSLGGLNFFRKTFLNSADGDQLFTNVQGQFKSLTVCGLLKKPFTEAAAVLKNMVSRESLGGGGASRATATKFLAIEIPDTAIQNNDKGNFALFQVDQSVMLTPDEESVHDISLAANAPIRNDRADTQSVQELVKMLLGVLDNTQPGSGPYSEAQTYLRWLNSRAHHVVKRIPNPDFSGQLGWDTYEDHRVRIASVPSISATVLPNGIVSDYKLTTGETRIPVTAAGIVTALRSNQNATAHATLKSAGYVMIPVAATIPGPFDP